MSDFPVEFTQMLATRMCHDLAGPISATNNGIELMDTESDPAMKEQAIDLLKLSAGEAAAKLQMYRVAYGRHDRSTEADTEEIRQIVSQFFLYNRIELDWPEESESGFPGRINHQLRQLVANMVLLVASQLVFGGTLTVRKEGKNIIVSGEHTRLKDDMECEMILRGKGSGEYTPQNVPAYFLLYHLRAAGAELDIQCTENTFKLQSHYS